MFNRRDQTKSTIALERRVKWLKLKLHNDTLIAARVDESILHMTWWKISEPDHVHREAAFKLTHGFSRLCSFDINGDFVLIRYVSENHRKKCDLWSIRNTIPEQISFAVCDLYLPGTGNPMNTTTPCDWTISTCENSQYLVASLGPEESKEFVLVFNNFTSPKYLHRITLPDLVEHIEVSEVDGGNGDFKTILVALTTGIFEFSDYKWCAYVYDIATGELIETFDDSDHGAYTVSGPYIFSKYVADKTYREQNKPIKISRINWNAEGWSTSTQLLKFPKSDSKFVSINQVTDTLVTWNTYEYFDETIGERLGLSLINRMPSKLVVSDFLLCDDQLASVCRKNKVNEESAANVTFEPLRQLPMLPLPLMQLPRPKPLRQLPNVAQLSILSLSTFTNKQIQIENNWLHDITEVTFIF